MTQKPPLPHHNKKTTTTPQQQKHYHTPTGVPSSGGRRVVDPVRQVGKATQEWSQGCPLQTAHRRCRHSVLC